jgi:hypothetical protein
MCASITLWKRVILIFIICFCLFVKISRDSNSARMVEGVKSVVAGLLASEARLIWDFRPSNPVLVLVAVDDVEDSLLHQEMVSFDVVTGQKILKLWNKKQLKLN